VGKDGVDETLKISIPYNFKARPYQLPLLAAMDSGCKRAVITWHRRAGKDIVTLNYMIKRMVQEVGIYYYVFPSYRQAKKVIWEGQNNDGAKFLDYFPPPLIEKKNDSEMKVILKNGSMFQLIGSDAYDCFDDQTEILTDDGWKLFQDLDGSEEVCGLCEGVIVFENPIKRMSYDYCGPMYTLATGSLDFKVTPNHRFWVRSAKGKDKFKIISDPSIRGYKVPAQALWVGEKKDVFTFPTLEKQWITGKGRVCHKIWNRSMPMHDFMALLGIYLSEGSSFRNKKAYRITISQTKENIRDDIRNLLERSAIRYCEHASGFNIEDKQLYTYFSQFGLQHERFIPKEIRALDKQYLSTLFEWLIKGDGSITDTGIYYFSTSKTLVDHVQEIIIKLGYSGRVEKKAQKSGGIIKGRRVVSTKPLYQIRLRTKKYKYFYTAKHKGPSITWYNGKVYCVNVPSGVIKVRRNGVEYWSGNSLMGTNPRGIIFSEFALQDPKAWEYIRPILQGNNGWAIFQSTPRGKNHFWELAQIAQNQPDWFYQRLTIDDTGLLTERDLDKIRDEGMNEHLIAQEYFTSFDQGMEGSFYGRYLDKMEKEGRICHVPVDPFVPVDTYWDLGVSDATSIIFVQNCGGEIHIVDHFECEGEGLDYYVRILRRKAEEELWVWGRHFAPHDIQVRELGHGAQTRLHSAKKLGISFEVGPRLPVQEGIDLVRGLFHRMWIDRQKCKFLLKCLENYHKLYNEKYNVYGDKPVHDWSSHSNDALRLMAMCQHKARQDRLTEKEAQELELKYAKV